jgi:hypothetical protein
MPQAWQQPNPGSGYQPQQPWSGPGGPTPPPVPYGPQQGPHSTAPPPGLGQSGPGGRGKRVNPVLVVAPLAVVAAIVIGIVIAFTLGDDSKTNSADTLGLVVPQSTKTSAPRASSAAAAPTAPAKAPAAAPGAAAPPGCTPVQPVPGAAPAGSGPVLDIGQSAVVTGQEYNDFEARVTLNSVCVQAAAFTSWSKPSAQGNFVLADITVEVVRGDVSASYIDFAVQTADGYRYKGDYSPVDPQLASFGLRAGQKARGFVLVDAPVGHNLLQWEPIFAANSAVWRY